MLDQVSLSDFLPHLNSVFRLETPGGALVDLRLAEATPAGSPAAPRPAGLASRQPFSIVFIAPSGCGLCQQIYRLHHPALGAFEVFLVPIGADPAGLKLEAIFN